MKVSGSVFKMLRRLSQREMQALNWAFGVIVRGKNAPKLLVYASRISEPIDVEEKRRLKPIKVSYNFCSVKQ